jgi:hypothetical protein
MDALCIPGVLKQLFRCPFAVDHIGFSRTDEHGDWRLDFFRFGLSFFAIQKIDVVFEPITHAVSW